MSLIILTLLVTYFISIMAEVYPSQNIKKKDKLENNKLLSLILVVIFILVAGFRSNIGDTATYMQSYIKNEYLSIHDFNSITQAFDFIFIFLLNKISKDPQLLIFSTSFIIYGFIIWRVTRESKNLHMSIFLFITTGCFVNSMNGIRQYIVVAILFFLYPYINKKPKIFVITIIMLLSLIHITALILLPIYLVSDSKPFSGKMIILFIGIAILFFGFEKIMPSVFDMLKGSKYAEYETAEYTQVSVNYFRILVSFVPVVLSFICVKNGAIKDKEYSFLINMSCFYFIFILFGIYGATYARFALYFELYPILLYPVIIKYGFVRKEESRMISYLMYVLFFMYFYYQMTIAYQNFTYKSEFLNLIIK